MTTENIIFIEEIIVILLLIASGVAVAARRLRVPYTVGLVIIGLVITLLNPQQVEFTPQIIMLLLVPPLVFEAAFHIRFDDLRRDFWLILLLAVPGVVLTTLLVGWLVSWGTGLALQAALVFGALIVWLGCVPATVRFVSVRKVFRFCHFVAQARMFAIPVLLAVPMGRSYSKITVIWPGPVKP